MQYDKLAIDFTDQLAVLKSYGLIIEDNEVALQQLHSISYFRFASYLQSFESNSVSHQLALKTHFNDVISLYVFDKNLRTLIFTAIQDIEIALRTRVIHYFSLLHNPFWFLDGSLFRDGDIHQVCLNKIMMEVGRSREDFISEYYAKYESPSIPPAWKTMEVLSFGTLSKLFCNFKDSRAKKLVAKDFMLPQYTYLENWMKCAAVLRNACAHHARIWNRRYPMIPTMPKYLPSSWISIQRFRPNKLYNQLCCLVYLEQSISPNGNFKGKLIQLLGSAPNEYLRHMGFPQEWQTEPLWK